MPALDSPPVVDPDLYSGELHLALLSEGLRGPQLRRLMRLARNNSELERIFETKLAEFKRFLRESRRPTLLNLPLRIYESFADHAKVTPPREAITTLAYVVFVLIALEGIKTRLGAESLFGDTSSEATAARTWDKHRPIRSGDLADFDPFDAIMTRNRLASTSTHGPTPKSSGAAVLDEAAIHTLVKQAVAEALKEAESKNPRSQGWGAWVTSDEFKSAVARAVKDALGEKHLQKPSGAAVKAMPADAQTREVAR